LKNVDAASEPTEQRKIVVYCRAHSDRGPVEAYIDTAYGRAFGGRIRDHYPTLIALLGPVGGVEAAVGVRMASLSGLFLEQYLDIPVEAAVERAFGHAVERARIAEIGNLASSGPLASLELFLGLARHLDAVGCTHAAATAINSLRRCFARSGLITRSLAQAESARLAAGADDWGSYYEREPEVLAGPIGPCIPVLAEMLRSGERTAARRSTPVLQEARP
jgi:hypothetical protein